MIALSEGVQTLDVRCFGNTDLVEVIIPKSVHTIAISAFDGCKKLEKVTFVEGSRLREIDDHAFSECCSLETIQLPDNL